MTAAKYKWDKHRGVVLVKEDRQAIQLLHGAASMEFREKCGKLLVAALNDEAKKGRKS